MNNYHEQNTTLKNYNHTTFISSRTRLLCTIYITYINLWSVGTVTYTSKKKKH